MSLPRRPITSADRVSDVIDVVGQVAAVPPEAPAAFPRPTTPAVDPELLGLVAQFDDHDELAPLARPVAALQPIVHLEADVVIGYEALARFDDGRSVLDHYAEAAAQGRAVELELLCCAAAFARIDELEGSSFVSTNVSVACLEDPGLFDQLRSVDTSRVSIELTQQSPISDGAILDHHLSALRVVGVRIAFDDVGIGDFSIERIAQTTPAILKASPRLVSGCDTDDERATRLRSVVELGRRAGAITIGVGVERPEEAAVLRRFGFDAAQGYLFGRPELPAEHALRVR